MCIYRASTAAPANEIYLLSSKALYCIVFKSFGPKTRYGRQGLQQSIPNLREFRTSYPVIGWRKGDYLGSSKSQGDTTSKSHF